MTETKESSIVSVYIGLEKDYRLICCMNKKGNKKKIHCGNGKVVCFPQNNKRRKKKVFPTSFNESCVYHDLISLSIAIVEVESVFKRKLKDINNI